jgi:hypothetical protein
VGAHDPASWRPILEQLGALGACAPAKAAAALSWIGTERIDLADLGWPISVQRDLDLKLTLTGDATLEAKSYFSYHAGWAALAAPSLTRSSSDAARPAS